jgi:hypothetical protein
MSHRCRSGNASSLGLDGSASTAIHRQARVRLTNQSAKSAVSCGSFMSVYALAGALLRADDGQFIASCS